MDEDFRTVVKKSKRRSASSTFSKRHYSEHKCASNCDLKTEVLTNVYNLIIKHNNYP